MTLEDFKKEFDEKLANTTDEELYDFFAGYEEDDEEYPERHDLEGLIREWREMADKCESEILRSKTSSTFLMSDDEVIRYEQAARSYRFCASSLESNMTIN